MTFKATSQERIHPNALPQLAPYSALYADTVEMAELRQEGFSTQYVGYPAHRDG